jgi:hypothetical protein
MSAAAPGSESEKAFMIKSPNENEYTFDRQLEHYL